MAVIIDGHDYGEYDYAKYRIAKRREQNYDYNNDSYNSRCKSTSNTSIETHFWGLGGVGG